jgi:tRNA 2-thiouridine synthesizing protein E
MKTPRPFKCNQEGYLLDFLSWKPSFAEQVAEALTMTLDEFDWEVIEFVRGYYEAHQLMPLTRVLVQYIKEDLDQGFDSIKFQERYTAKPLWVLAQLSGLPKPAQCI